MSISTKQEFTLEDDVTGEVVKVSVLDTGNFMVTINGVENELKEDIFEAFVDKAKDLLL